ncbi:MAG: Xaa-Pro dipeptidase [Chloroflexota bacterium]|jgi:Xaa-Pro aminopeptidase|nr:Xaa-Pro dipeptidase [Chloroflexota bacterium]
MMAVSETAIGERALPSFSIPERDRRWGRLRQLMADQGIDVLVAAPNTGSHDKHQADARYLTQFGLNGENAACVFPREGKVVGFGGRSSKLVPHWMEDVRTPDRPTAAHIVEALEEVGAAHATIGICGLTASRLLYMRAPDGVAPYAVVSGILAAFPQAKIVSATEVLAEARMVKGEEEIAFLARGEALAEAAQRALLTTVRPGVAEARCYAAMLAAEVERGGSLPFAIGWLSGPVGDVYPHLTQPTGRIVQAGDVILAEIEGRWAGYTAQIDQSTYVGQVPAACRDAWAVAVDAFERAVAAMRPGVTFGELMTACAATPAVGGWEARLGLHGRGLGDDGPLIRPSGPSPQLANRPLQEGNVFIVRPAVDRDGRGDVARIGDSVVVTANGAQRLGTRSFDFAAYNVGF